MTGRRAAERRGLVRRCRHAVALAASQRLPLQKTLLASEQERPDVRQTADTMALQAAVQRRARQMRDRRLRV